MLKIYKEYSRTIRHISSLQRGKIRNSEIMSIKSDTQGVKTYKKRWAINDMSSILLFYVCCLPGACRSTA